VKDLLLAENPSGGLTIRQHPRKGFFVDGLTQTAVSSYLEVRCFEQSSRVSLGAQVEKRMSQGTINRTTASTLMNETSSRSHMVIIIKFKQVSPQRMPCCLKHGQVVLDELNKSTTITSDINLVDLAGSERADSSGAAG
jgi:hypothetical protein